MSIPNTLFSRPSSSPLLGPGSSGTWEATLVANPAVIKDTIAGGWLMSYSGWSDALSLWATGYATAPNLTNGGTWAKGSNNPIRSPSGGSDGFITANGNICIKGSTYYNFYIHATSDFTTIPGAMCLDTATSLTGTWTKQNSGNPVMSGTPSSPDAVGVADPAVYLMADGVTFECIYQAQASGGAPRQYLRATSTDGITWTKQGLFAPTGPNLTSAQGEPSILRDGTLINMFHDEAVSDGNRRTIGRSFSRDSGVTWSWRTQALGPSVSDWDSIEVFDNWSVLIGGQIYLFHAGTNVYGSGSGGQGAGFQIGYAVADYYPGVY
jgi:hypothetical protein